MITRKQARVMFVKNIEKEALIIVQQLDYLASIKFSSEVSTKVSDTRVADKVVEIFKERGIGHPSSFRTVDDILMVGITGLPNDKVKRLDYLRKWVDSEIEKAINNYERGADIYFNDEPDEYNFKNRKIIEKELHQRGFYTYDTANIKIATYDPKTAGGLLVEGWHVEVEDNKEGVEEE